MGSTANSPNHSFKGRLHRGTLTIRVFSGRACVCWCTGAGRASALVYVCAFDRNAGELTKSSAGSPEHQAGLCSDVSVLLTPLTHHGCEPTYSQILPVLLLSATLRFLCGKVNYAGDVLLQPKGIAKIADKSIRTLVSYL